MLLAPILPLLAAPFAPPLVDALGAWHTRYAIVGTTGTYDFFRHGDNCVLGVPRNDGAAIRRCGTPPTPDPGQTPPADVAAVLERAARDERYGWAAAGLSTDDWAGAWREVTLLELVPTPTEGARGGLVAEGAAAWDGASGVYGWQKKAQLPPLDAARWIDWRPPADLDGTFVALSARSDPRYAAPAAALDEAIRTAVTRYLGGQPLPTSLPEVPGGPLYTLPDTRFAVEWVVFIESELASDLGLPWDFRDIDLPVALLSDPVRYEFPLAGSPARLLITVSSFGATFELGAPGPACERWSPARECQRPDGTVEETSGAIALPLHREGTHAALAGPIVNKAVGPDSALGATNGVDRRQWIITTQAEPSRQAWRGEQPLIVLGPSAPPPPPAPPGATPPRLSSGRWHATPPPTDAFVAPASASASGHGGRWQVRAERSVFPLELVVQPGEDVRLEAVAFYGTSPPFPHDAAPGAAQVVDARAVQDLRWTFEGERPRWVRLRWTIGDRLLATAILPL